jgi:hypothetical protein
MFRDWETEVAGRIAAIRAERTSEGVALTPQQARALAGEWYAWFIAKHPVSDRRKWEELRDRVQEALQDAAGEDEWERSGPDEFWREERTQESGAPSPSGCRRDGTVLDDEGTGAQWRSEGQLPGLALRRLSGGAAQVIMALPHAAHAGG